MTAATPTAAATATHIPVNHGQLEIARPLYQLVVEEILPGLGIDPVEYWRMLGEVITELAPQNNILLLKRYKLQAEIDTWHQSRCDAPHDHAQYRRFLEKIGYLLPEGPDFQINPQHVDEEIARLAGPQLVVPVKNARYALNATNARWGSLYDALYGSDVIPETDGAGRTPGYNPVRGERVIAYARGLLDRSAPLTAGSHADAVAYKVVDGALLVRLRNDGEVGLQEPAKFVGYNGNPGAPGEVLLRNNGLHLIIQIDPGHPVGRADAAHVKDVVLESAVTTIQDCEDSVAAADGADKAEVYRNWLGLMKSTHTDTFEKNGKTITRTMAPDLHFLDPRGEPFALHGRALLIIRNVGHLMTNEAVLMKGEEVPEGILDAVITGTIALYDLRGLGQLRNSRTGSMYIVKPKMHGPEEVAFACALFDKVEDMLGLPRHTLKIGVMDEERRTTVNLKECIRAAQDRLIFINTGFLDLMNEMVNTKLAHLRAGASTAWVPSPTAATLHAMHYHEVNVWEVQNELKKRPRASLDDILTIPLLGDTPLTREQVQAELDNNCQGILGYVVRWIDLGIGCSKVPDWLRHDYVRRRHVLETFKRMAVVVDRQNANEPGYKPMSANFDESVAFQAACELVFGGVHQPNGYTEPVLHRRRRELKAAAQAGRG